MRALGLDHNNPHHEGYYRAMRVSPSLDKRADHLKWLLTEVAGRMRRLLCTTG
jgi:hypothetical protein